METITDREFDLGIQSIKDLLEAKFSSLQIDNIEIKDHLKILNGRTGTIEQKAGILWFIVMGLGGGVISLGVIILVGYLWH